MSQASAYAKARGIPPPAAFVRSPFKSKVADNASGDCEIWDSDYRGGVTVPAEYISDFIAWLTDTFTDGEGV